MKAVICTRYGSPDVLKLSEKARPIPRSNEVLIQVAASTVTSADIRIRSFDCPPLFWLPMRLALGMVRPRQPILGVELAGEVVETGSRATKFRMGDSIYAMTGMRLGAHAEYICVSENGTIALKPENATYEEAAAIPFGGTTALHFLRKARIRKGHRVLVYGASGAVGTAVVQLARHLGAEVTAVCSAANEELVRSLGASRAIDYARENFAAGSARYDIVFDAVGKTSKSACKSALAPGGVFVTVEGQGMARETAEDLGYLRELVEAGAYRAVIDRRYALEQAAEAHRYVDTGRKRGSVVLTISR